MKLNPQQRIAVEYCDGPLLVLAGAGSGKTRVIAEKIAHLVRHKHLAPRKIAAITFTNRAAREMRERAARLLKGEAADELTVCTFHALGLKLLQIEHAKVGLRRGFSVFDADDSAANDQAVQDGSRILSAYLLNDDKTKVWIITEATDDTGNRAATTLLLPDEY